MKTYSETQGKAFFDWNAFLENPPQKRKAEFRIACNLAGEWVTCACGNLCDIIPRDMIGCPYDSELELLGLDFHHSIAMANFIKAKETLAKIEKRSEEIIFQLTK